MKKLITFSIILLLGLAGCSAKLEQIGATRFTEESDEGYREEMGTLTKEGFAPMAVMHKKYDDQTSASRDEVRKVNGKLVLELAHWSTIGKLSTFKRSKETVTINEIPYVFVEP